MKITIRLIKIFLTLKYRVAKKIIKSKFKRLKIKIPTSLQGDKNGI